MKKYRLRNEVKKYFAERFHVMEMTQKDWGTNSVTIEALEEVEEKIKVNLSSWEYENDSLFKNMGDESWTDQEREDIEKFLNVFGSWDNMQNYINRYAEYVHFYTEEKSSFESFGSWLKDIKINETTN